VALRTAQVDLTNCDREPIHLSGAIQPHGILIVLDNADLRVVQASNNVEGMLGVGPAQILGGSIEQILGTANFHLLRNATRRTAIEAGNPVAMTVSTPRGELQVDAVLHRSSGQIVVELEPVDIGSRSTAHDFHRIVRGAVDKFAAVQTVQHLCDAAAAQVGHIAGFDRVMIYRFDHDWHGE
jgi:chemotaxis family two-component system sensor kinase Cph1